MVYDLEIERLCEVASRIEEGKEARGLVVCACDVGV
jgi:hypothetical protein